MITNSIFIGKQAGAYALHPTNSVFITGRPEHNHAEFWIGFLMGILAMLAWWLIVSLIHNGKDK